MKKIVLICGPESCGNRLVTALFVREGFFGSSSSTGQPSDDAIIKYAPSIAIIHGHLEDTHARLERFSSLEDADVRAIILNRELHALRSSMTARGHVSSVEDAEKRISLAYRQLFKWFGSGRIPFNVLSYEALVGDPYPTIKWLMDWAGIPAPKLYDQFMWENRLFEGIYNGNSRWYQ